MSRWYFYVWPIYKYMKIFNTYSSCLKYIRAYSSFMFDRYKKCLPVVLSRLLKDETMFHSWMKVSFTFILGWTHFLLSSLDESIQFLAKTKCSDWKSWGSGLRDGQYFYLSKFAKIGTFLVCLATSGPFSAYLHRLAEPTCTVASWLFLRYSEYDLSDCLNSSAISTIAYKAPSSSFLNECTFQTYTYMSKSISSRLQESPRKIEAYFGDYSFLFSIVLGPHLIIYILADSFSLPTFCKVYFHHPSRVASCRVQAWYLFILFDNIKCYNIYYYHILHSSFNPSSNIANSMGDLADPNFLT
jgi:hypothetical protein